MKQEKTVLLVCPSEKNDKSQGRRLVYNWVLDEQWNRIRLRMCWHEEMGESMYHRNVLKDL